MNIIKENIEELFTETQYIKRKEYDDKIINELFNRWIFFEEYEKDIQRITNELVDVILYSKYYWSSRFIERYEDLYGLDVSIEQQRYKIIEELERRISGDIDWEFIESLENEKISQKIFERFRC